MNWHVQEMHKAMVEIIFEESFPKLDSKHFSFIFYTPASKF